MSLKSICALCAAAVLLSACASTDSQIVSVMQKKDKVLTCKEIMLEMNEAEFYRKAAEDNKGPKLKNLVMPLGYVSTYVKAENAIDASSARIEYLNRVYEIQDCDNPSSEANRRPPANLQGVGGYGPGQGSGYQGAGYYNHDAQAPGHVMSQLDEQWYW